MEDFEEQIIGLLQAIASNSGDQYEPKSIYTVGGSSGQYLLRSPYNTEAEFSVVGALAQGATPAGVIYVSPSNPGIYNLTSTPPSVGVSPVNGGNQGAENNAFEGYILPLTGSQAPFFNEYWQALGRNVDIYVNVQMSAGMGYLVVAFRRKLDHIIPDKPRQKPHTHTHVGSRAPLRRLAAQSTMVAGYESQYPEAGGPPFQHQFIPVNPQDTSVAKRGIFPLGPTPSRKVGRNGR